MSPYLILALIIAAITIVGWLVAAILESKSKYSDGGWYVAAGFLTFIVLFAGLPIGASEIAEHQYRNRIQEKYDIDVIASFEDDSYGYAVYADGNCVARKAPNDVLYQVGCVEGGFVEVGE